MCERERKDKGLMPGKRDRVCGFEIYGLIQLGQGWGRGSRRG